ncbi:tyrosine-type recombinase/integrase [Streptomyces sp. NPDC053499]|uniref:tyrosine-type recombinase/integrase n=1 Tax=Streptomyces sp. NPDC053499 TaxID=3365707 RepID=UPI0037D26385
MAYITKRQAKDGTTTYQVRWIEGGGRTGEGQSEKFGDEDSAKTFKTLVNAHGQHWPPGWVRGKGFVEESTDPDDVPLLPYCHRYVDRLTGIDERTREDYRREVDRHLSLIQHTQRSGLVVPATIVNLTDDDVQDWVRLQEKGEKSPDDPETWLRRPAHPKSIRNRHGLLWCIVQAAVDAELRTSNCCRKTKMPRVDDGTDEEMCFLERDEYARIRAELPDNDSARDLADWLVGTGMRWGEATALQVRDVRGLNSSTPTVSVQRAWKKAPKGSGKSYFLGPPKTKKARRVLGLSASQVDMLRRLTSGQRPEAFIFRTVLGNAWLHPNYYNRKWLPAVNRAVEKGLPRRPRLHDLRHTHVAWLIAANIPLPAIQVRLGHESIQTTVDRYGHLVRELDAEISAAVEAAMSVPEQRDGLRVVQGG